MLGRFKAGALALFVALTVGGCAIHPLPENVAGAPTYVIVRQIRCEAREAVIQNAIGWLTSDSKVDSVSRQIGVEFAEGRRPTQQLSPKLFRGQVSQILSAFYDTGIAYNFDLDMSEINNFDPQIDLLRPLPTKFTMGIKGQFDRKRENERMFTVTDSFSGLIKMPDAYCNDPAEPRNYVVGENYIYPINGKIGMKRMIQDFVLLTLFGDLAGPAAKTTGPPTLVDQLSFTTEISGTVTPTITFTPVGTLLQVSDASFSAQADRKDLHKVTVGLAIAGAGIKEVAPLRTSLFAAPLLSASPRTAGEQNAAAAVNQFLTLKIFQPNITVTTP